MGELGFVIVNFDAINEKIAAASGVVLDNSKYFWTSTEYDDRRAWCLHSDAGIINLDIKSGNYLVRAFLQL